MICIITFIELINTTFNINNISKNHQYEYSYSYLFKYNDFITSEFLVVYYIVL